MNASARMVVVLGVITLASGLALGALNEATWELAANNVLKYKKIPAVVDILATMGRTVEPAERPALEESLLADKRTVERGEGAEPLLLFVLRDGAAGDGQPIAVALEGTGQGFGGDVGVMVGIDLASGNVTGMGVTTMSETPGVGTRVREPGYAAQYAGLPSDTAFKVKKDGGTIDAITGATISSRAVAAGVQEACDTWRAHESEIRAAVQAPPATDAPGGVS